MIDNDNGVIGAIDVDKIGKLHSLMMLRLLLVSFTAGSSGGLFHAWCSWDWWHTSSISHHCGLSCVLGSSSLGQLPVDVPGSPRSAAKRAKAKLPRIKIVIVVILLASGS